MHTAFEGQCVPVGSSLPGLALTLPPLLQQGRSCMSGKQPIEFPTSRGTRMPPEGPVSSQAGLPGALLGPGLKRGCRRGWGLPLLAGGAILGCRGSPMTRGGGALTVKSSGISQNSKDSLCFSSYCSSYISHESPGLSFILSDGPGLECCPLRPLAAAGGGECSDWPALLGVEERNALIGQLSWAWRRGML